MESLAKPSTPRKPADIAQGSAVAFLTVAGLAGAVVAAASAMSGWQVRGGCGGLAGLGALILAAAFVVVVAWFSAYCVGAVLGIALVWIHRAAGAAILMMTNLLLLPVFAVFELTSPGQVLLCALLVALATLAIAGAALAAWILVSGVARKSDRAVIAAVFVLVASPFLLAYVNGLGTDVQETASISHPVAATGCGGTGS